MQSTIHQYKDYKRLNPNTTNEEKASGTPEKRKQMNRVTDEENIIMQDMSNDDLNNNPNNDTPPKLSQNINTESPNKKKLN